MKEMLISKKYIVLVDDDVVDMLLNYTWYVKKKPQNIYARAYVKKPNGKLQQIFMHRLILGIDKEPSKQCDHINHNGLDNRRENLRIATSFQNQGNKRKTQLSASSLYKGVSWDTQKKLWVAEIGCNYKHIKIGRFKIEKDAASAYNEAAKKQFNEFAFLNKI